MSSPSQLGPALGLLLALLALLLSATGLPAGSRGDRQQASWDEVNVVAHGLLQLGQALREHVEKTRAQVRELSGGLRSVNASLQGAAAAAGARDHRELSRRMDRLEQRVEEAIRRPALDGNSSDDDGVSLVQRMMAVQNRRLDQLMDKIKQQQDKLEKQSVHLQTLQSKVGHKRMKSLRQRHDELMEKQDGAQQGFAADCHELFVQGQTQSGVYTVQPERSPQPFRVLCEMTPEGGWTVIQKRYDGSQSFDQTWDSYRRGFGGLHGEFWLGLDRIHALSRGRGVLQIVLSDWSRQSHVTSAEFRLKGEEGLFSLHLGPEASPGSAGLPFSTADQDHDLSAGDNCAQKHSGGWWFSDCGGLNLNGDFPSGAGGSRDMFWTTAAGQRTTLRSSVMKVAPASIRH